MRKIILSAAVAIVAAASFAAPSQAGYYNSYDYQPHCFIKKVKSWDYYGNLVIKRVKVCK
jgi:hypothetical protein